MEKHTPRTELIVRETEDLHLQRWRQLDHGYRRSGQAVRRPGRSEQKAWSVLGGDAIIVCALREAMELGLHL